LAGQARPLGARNHARGGQDDVGRIWLRSVTNRRGATSLLGRSLEVLPRSGLVQLRLSDVVWEAL